MNKVIFVWRIPIALTDLVEEYRIELTKEKILQLAGIVPSLDELFEKCEQTRKELKIEDENFSIKLFLAVMFNSLRFYWATKTTINRG